MEFSKRKIIQDAWNALRQNLGLWATIVLFVIAINLLLSTVQDLLMEDITIKSIMFTIAAYLFQMGINLGMIRISLNIVNGKMATFKDMFGSFHILIPYVCASIIFLLILIVSALPGGIILYLTISIEGSFVDSPQLIENSILFVPILLILFPMIYVSIRLQFYNYFLIEKESSIMNSIKLSSMITKGFVAELFLLGAMVSLIILISIIPLGAGLIISIPLGIMINTILYKKLNKNFIDKQESCV